jgi:hypothetical protein
MSYCVTAITTAEAERVRAEIIAGVRPATILTLDEAGPPCRHCLEVGSAGEEMLLLTYQPFAGESAYTVPSPIFLHAAECRRFENEGLPALATHGLRAVRSYDAGHALVEGEVAEGAELESTIVRLLASPNAAYLHVHSATAGCFTFRVDHHRPILDI